MVSITRRYACHNNTTVASGQTGAALYTKGQNGVYGFSVPGGKKKKIQKSSWGVDLGFFGVSDHDKRV